MIAPVYLSTASMAARAHLANHIVLLSQADTFEDAVQEWSHSFISDLGDNSKFWEECPCGQEIRYKHFIVNEFTGAVTYVGSVCINRFPSMPGQVAAPVALQAMEALKALKRSRSHRECSKCERERPIKSGLVLEGRLVEGEIKRSGFVCCRCSRKAHICPCEEPSMLFMTYGAEPFASCFECAQWLNPKMCVGCKKIMLSDEPQPQHKNRCFPCEKAHWDKNVAIFKMFG